MRILGIETSCDETGVSIIEASGGIDTKDRPLHLQRTDLCTSDFSFTVLGNALLSQTATHAPYGGVFPNLAKREHERNLVPLLQNALADAGILAAGSASVDTSAILEREAELRMQLDAFLAAHAKPDIDAIAVTHGPGLEPALWVGVNFAKALAAAWDLPIVPVNHMEGHIIVSMMEDGRLADAEFPLLSLLVSGGHTELVLSNEPFNYRLIGQTRDDAVGEAFDKVARLMDLPYPGGPEIDRLASEARKNGIVPPFKLPRPMIDTDDYDFSFSGLKTAVRKIVDANQPLSDDFKRQLAREFEDACADVIVAKTVRALEEYGARTLVVGGGVSANAYLRERLADAVKDYGSDAKLLIPPRQLATDNALMIALAGYFRALKKEFAEPATIRANGNLRLE